ncbi:hypothetical protein AQB9606_00001 [Aquabacterium sp. CECT 9606]|nr:hypothetical protein AQB9606_00001 [Aquabacterium sp. CECT 9606]
MAGAGDQGGAQGLVVGIGVIGQHGAAVEHAVFVDRGTVVHGHGHVVDGVDGDGDGGQGGVGRAIVGLVGEGVGAIEVGGWRVGVAAIGVEHQGTVAGAGDQGGAQGLVVGIGVIGQHGAAVEHAVFVDRGTVVHGHGRVVDGVDGDGDGGQVGVGRAIVGLVGEGVGAVEVGGRRVGVAAIGVEHQGAVAGAGDQGGGQGVVVGIAVIGQHGAAVEHAVFVDRGAVVHGHRRVAEWVDGDGDGDRHRVSRAIVGHVGERVAAAEIRIGRVGVAAIGVEGQGAVGRAL